MILTYVTTVKRGHELICKSSIENQTTSSFEWVLFEDCECNRPKALNKALSKVKTPYFALVDADDRLSLNATEAVVLSLSQTNNNNTILYSLCENDPRERAKRPLNWLNLWETLVPFHLRVERLEWWTNGLTFNEKFLWQSDYERVLRLFEWAEFSRIDEYLYRYNTSTQISKLSLNAHSKRFTEVASFNSRQRVREFELTWGRDWKYFTSHISFSDWLKLSMSMNRIAA